MLPRICKHRILYCTCHNYATFRTIFMNELNSTNTTLNTEFDELIRAIFYADKNFDNDSNFKNY